LETGKQHGSAVKVVFALGNQLIQCSMIIYFYLCRWWRYWNSSSNTLSNVFLQWKSYCCAISSATLIWERWELHRCR